MRALWVLAALALGCRSPDPPRQLPRELAPVAEPRVVDEPHRDRPRAIVEAQGRFFVALGGTETRPGRELAVLDAETLEVIDHVEVGPSPYALAVHPGGRFVAVACRYASYVPVVDARTLHVVAEIRTPFYTEDIAFSPDGTRAALTNRWKDSLIRWRVRAHEDSFEATVVDSLVEPLAPVGIPMPENPRRVRFLDDRRVLVTSETSLRVALVDIDDGMILAEHSPNGPVTDAIVVGEHVYVLHTGSGSGHPPATGFDGDGDGTPGDGTANVTFQDVQNEIDVLSARDLSLLHRYTSDTICCHDYRDVDPEDPEAGLELLPVDRWPPDRVAFMPPRETWIVAGAMPERIVATTRADGSSAVAVLFGGSSEVQTFDRDVATGALSPRETAGGLFETGHGAMDLAVRERDGRLVVVERLAETVSLIDLDAPPDAARETQVVGDLDAGPFPASDAELGEAFNTMTARFSIDGDQTCAHCHRDGSPIAKAVSMPLLETPEWGVRNVMAYRGAFDSRPWFVEAAMDEDNFFPVINELARRENFCCEGGDVRVWSRYPSRDECTREPELGGCVHVLDCLNQPPPECATRRYGGTELTRDRHFRAAALEVLGRDESFGDALYTERLGPDGEITRRPVSLGFDGITRALGAFLLADSRLLPNPNAAVAGARASLGASLFASTRTGCAGCHPLPVGATSLVEGPLAFPYVVSPILHPTTGLDVDRVNPAFLVTFPEARQTEAGLRIGVTSLRGLWDRGRFLHHGLARSLREALATPGHPALREGDVAFNELFGQPDTHGGTSALSADELNALVTFLETL